MEKDSQALTDKRLVDGVSPPPSTARRPPSFISRILPSAVLGVILLLAWELAVRLSNLREVQLPSPSRILEAAITQLPLIADHTWATLQVALVGLAASVLVGAA